MYLHPNFMEPSFAPPYSPGCDVRATTLGTPIKRTLLTPRNKCASLQLPTRRRMSATMSVEAKRAPFSVRESRVVVVGGGPVGTVAACMLWSRGVRDVTLLEKVRDFDTLNPSKSYSLGVFPRGLKALEVVPGLKETVASNGATPRQIIRLGKEGTTKSFPFQPPFTSIRYFAREKLLGCLKAFLLERTMVSSRFGSKLMAVRYEKDGIELDIETDGKTETLLCDLLVAADGKNSRVVSSLRDADSSIVKSRRGFGAEERYSSSVGLKVKSLILNPSVFKRAGITEEDIASSLVVLDSAVSSRPVKGRVKLGTLPTPTGQIESAGGLLGVMVNPENSMLWSVRTVDEFYSLLERNFPVLDIRELMPKDRVESFLRTKPGEFPPITRVNSLTAKIASRRGVVVMGDAAHSFPPDSGLGVNSGFEDVAKLAFALDSLSDQSTVCDVLSEYERLNDDEISALVHIARVASPFQYGNAPFRRKVLMAYNFFRALLAKEFPLWFKMPLMMQVLSLEPYTVIVEGDRTSRRIISLFSIAFFVAVFALSGYVFTYY